MNGFSEAVGRLQTPLGPEVDRGVDHCRLRHQQIDIGFRLPLHRHQDILMPNRRIAMCEIGHAGLEQPPFDAPQDGLNCTSGQLPGSCQSSPALRVIAQVVGELGARPPVAQAAGLVHDHRIRSEAILEARRIFEIRYGHLVPQPALQCQRHALPCPEVSRIALGGRIAPARIGQRRRGFGRTTCLISHEQTDCIATAQAFRPRSEM